MRAKSILTTALAVPALVAMMGATNCQYFTTVTIPASDTVDPTLGTRLFFFGEEEIAFWPIYRETSDLDASFVAFPAMIDAGGARRLEVSQTVEVWCKDASSGEPTTGVNIHFIPISDEQAGSVGSKVKNGIYLQGQTISFGEYTSHCSGTNTVDEIVYTWAMAGEDFAGNTSDMLGGQITYVP